MNLDKVTQAIAGADIQIGYREPIPWDELSDYGKDQYRRMAQAAIDAMQLTKEWGVQITENGKTVIETHPGTGEPMDRETAFYENRRWPSYGYNTEGVRSRLVSPWTNETAMPGLSHPQ